MDPIHLDKNESYWLLDEHLSKKCLAFQTKDLSTYPDYSYLKKQVAVYAGVDADQVCMTAGSDAVIEHIGRSFIEPNKIALLPVPTFYGYETILKRTNTLIMPVSYTEKDSMFVFPTQEILNNLDNPDVSAIFLCQPNNPLGLLIPDDEINKVVQKAAEKNILLISDEAYFEYGREKTLLHLLPTVSNLLIIRTFSKAFGLSGARVGYCIGNKDIISKLQKLLLPWPIAHLSTTAASAALIHRDLFANRRKIYIEQRESFFKELSSIPNFTTYPSETNFFLLRVPNALRAQSQLKEKGIHVALGEPMSHYPDAQHLLRSTLRIAIPSPKHTKTVLDGLRSIDFTN